VLREQGSHNELIREKGLYWRLFQLQYGEAIESEKALDDLTGGAPGYSPATGS
jgi:hypothetical protein